MDFVCELEADMNERVNRLRRATLEATPRLSIERAALLTEFCRKDKTTSVPIRRARAFQYIMENKEIYIGKDELIVGERGPTPKAAPTFPSYAATVSATLKS